ncbi:formate transporter FocA [Ferrimonas marina]|uniref:formate transporter FocA n=1 Tax=Ferrimonas marina TaxID=299255 RepID=UPI00082BF28F|nr:formate transporter FocA [Ferrimonas marina]
MLTLVSNKPSQDPILTAALKSGLAKLSRSTGRRLALSVLAGIYIGLAFTFYVTVLTGADALPWGLSRLMGGLVFSLGLILVVVCGAELFTSTVLTVIPWAKGLVRTGPMLRHWTLVFCGNALGALLLVGLLWLAGQHGQAGGQWGLKLMSVAKAKLHYDFGQAVVLGALCNLLVCLGIWMSFSAKDPMGKAALLVLPVAMFVSAGFEHSIANLFLIPMGIAIHQFADASFWQAVGTSPAQYADLTWSHFLQANLLPVTLGNILGGALFVGLSHWWIHGRQHDRQPHSNALLPKGNSIMSHDATKLTAGDLIDRQPLTLSPETGTREAAIALLGSGANAVLVVDQGKPVGQLDEQDLLRGYYLADQEGEMAIAELMQPLPFVATVDEPLVKLADRLAVDREKLYPISDAGYLTRYSDLSLARRAQLAAPNSNGLVLVMEGEVLAGVVHKRHVLAAMAGVAFEKAKLSTAA